MDEDYSFVIGTIFVIKISLAKKNIPWTGARRIAQKKIKNSV